VRSTDDGRRLLGHALVELDGEREELRVALDRIAAVLPAADRWTRGESTTPVGGERPGG
jgi:hypothetical protein